MQHQGAGMERSWGELKAQYREDVSNGYILNFRRSSETLSVNKLAFYLTREFTAGGLKYVWSYIETRKALLCFGFEFGDVKSLLGECENFAEVL